MRTLLPRKPVAVLALVLGSAAVGCSANGDLGNQIPGGGSGATGGTGGGTGIDFCGTCGITGYVPCLDNNQPGSPINCGSQRCVPDLGCADCLPGTTACVGNDVQRCGDDGFATGEVVESCDIGSGDLCGNGKCGSACEIAAESPSNVGCEFWAVDLDQQDGLGNDPASAPWGVVLSNVGTSPANITIEGNTAALGAPATPFVVASVTVAPGTLHSQVLPTRELDCGTRPNDYASPGTCLSSQAYRIVSSSPIVVYQFNTFENAFSNDASLLLPSNALGKVHRVLGWNAGHPASILGSPVDRSYVTVVGTQNATQVTVTPSWRIKGNPPIALTQPGGTISVTLNPFDVLNLETDDATLQEAGQPDVADLTGTIVTSDKPVAVFSGVESTSSPYSVDVPTYPGWDPELTCCLDHLEEQMMPVESLGSRYVVTRSPVRSTSGWREPDVLRFMGVAETAHVTTTLPPPYNDFTLAPGEYITTSAQDDVIVTSDTPIMIAQILISNERVDGPFIGDPSMTTFSPVDQFRNEYVIPTPPSWNQNWVVIAAQVGSLIDLDGMSTSSCMVESSGMLDGVAFESRRCPLSEGVHRLSGDLPFGIVAYGYGSAGSYAFVGGADVKPIYSPPPLR